MSTTYNTSAVAFRINIEPRFYITFEEDYWQWRDEQPKSTNIEEDLRIAMAIIGISIKKDSPISAADVEKALCEKSFLFSSRLARVMNYYGVNATPNLLYSSLVFRLSENNTKKLDFEFLIKAVMSNLKEIEQMFDES